MPNKTGSNTELIGDWAECRDGAIGRIVQMDKQGYCTLEDSAGKVIKQHEPLGKMKLDNEDGAIFVLGEAGKKRR